MMSKWLAWQPKTKIFSKDREWGLTKLTKLDPELETELKTLDSVSFVSSDLEQIRKTSDVPMMATQVAAGILGEKPPADDDLALRITTFLETLPCNQSATASEIAEGLFGRKSTLDQTLNCYHSCREMEQDNVLILGLDGYGYQRRERQQ